VWGRRTALGDESEQNAAPERNKSDGQEHYSEPDADANTADHDVPDPMRRTEPNVRG
jgi:hypothetical protein